MSSRTIIAAMVVAAWPSVSAGQSTVPRPLARPLVVNDEWERYARIRQIAGDAPLYPWTVRTFTHRESERLADAPAQHPWAARTQSPDRRAGAARYAILPLSARVVVNSAFPFGYNDGAMWTGRGLTSQLQVGAQASAWDRVFYAMIAPELVRAENGSFTLRPTGLPGSLSFADAFEPLSIDQPQRFGSSAYQQFNGGQSRAEVDAYGAVLAFSTANQHWGPARDHPLILGNNAAGFPHIFLGSSQPTDLWIAKAHARLMWGRLDASEYTEMRAIERYRLATGLAATFVPRGVPGLEVGFARFFHIQWSDSVLSVENLLRPFIGIVRRARITSSDPLGDEPDNQLASLFARWVFPESGVELYGEFAKEDYNATYRDLVLEPDHISGYLVGLQRVTKARGERYTVFRGEILNTRLSPLTLNRPQSPFYIHFPLRQGHTHAGQVLGSIAAFGGGASTVGVDRYTPRGRVSLAWSRMMRAEYRPTPTGMPVSGRADLFHTITADGVLFRGPLAITAELTGVYEINRHFASDATNLRVASGVRYTW